MNNLDIFCFTSVARTKNFSITAKELRISQQAVSKHIKNIEEELGYTLFFRALGSVELTRAGEYMLDFFSRQSGIVEEIRKRFMVPDKESSITIACSQWTGCPEFLTRSIQSYHETSPSATIHLLDLDANEVLQALALDQIDVLITTRYMARQLPVLWDTIPLTQLPLYLIYSNRSSCQPDRRHLHPFYAPFAGEKQDNAIHMRVKRTCRSLGFTPGYISVCQDMGSVMLNVLLNDGITLGCYPPDSRYTSDFAIEKTEQSVEVVLCMPYCANNTLVQKFCNVLTEVCQHE